MQLTIKNKHTLLFEHGTFGASKGLGERVETNPFQPPSASKSGTLYRCKVTTYRTREQKLSDRDGGGESHPGIFFFLLATSQTPLKVQAFPRLPLPRFFNPNELKWQKLPF